MKKSVKKEKEEKGKPDANAEARVTSRGNIFKVVG